MYALVDTSCATKLSLGRILGRYRSLERLARDYLRCSGSVIAVLISRHHEGDDALRTACTSLGAPRRPRSTGAEPGEGSDRQQG